MLVTSKQKPEPVRIPVRGAMRKKGERKQRITKTIAPIKMRLKANHR